MKYINYFIILCIITLLNACSKEDALEPSGKNDDYFSVNATSSNATDKLRLEFHEATGIHLLFNDTLRHEQRGTYEDGTPYWFTETVDLNFLMTSHGDGDYSFDYLTDYSAQETAAEIVKTYLLPHMGKALRPYSILVVKQIKDYDSSNEEYKFIDFVDSWRCLALTMGDPASQSEEELTELMNEVLYTIIENKLKSDAYESLFEEFASYCSNYYYEYWEDCDLPSYMDPTNLTQEDYYTLGFLSEPDNYWADFPNQRTDILTYFDYIYYEDESTFKNEFANYPIVIAKYDLLKQIIVNTYGYIF